MGDMQRPWLSRLRSYEPRTYEMLEAHDGNRNVARGLRIGGGQMNEIEHSVAGQREQRRRDCGSRIPNACAMRRRERMHRAYDRRRQPFDSLRSDRSASRENPTITPRGYFWSESWPNAHQFDIAMQPGETDVA